MANRSPEQDLINSFVDALHMHSNNDLKIKKLINQSCKSRKYADVEFTTLSGEHWVIEAKSNDSSDAHNSVHKIFGELLKETGKTNRSSCKFGVLLPENARDFYSRLFQEINKTKFIEFGKIIPVTNVFLYGSSGISLISWEELYNLYQS